MKRIILVGCTLAAYLNVHAQGVSPHSMNCLEPFIYTHPTTPGAYSIPREFAGHKCIDMHRPAATSPGGVGNLITEGITNLVAGESIHIGEDMHIDLSTAPLVGGLPASVHAYIGNNAFEVFWFEPNSSPGSVGQYEKLELGIRLPDSIETRINRFVHDSIGGNKLNPFNPNEIDVRAEFYSLGSTYNTLGISPYRTVYGFYYREFEKSINGNANNYDDGWNEDTTSFPFRIRFAPPHAGNWAVKISIVLPDQTLHCTPINFTCAPSSNPGYFSISPNHKYFMQGGQTFFPIGQNLMTPLATSNLPMGVKPGTHEWYSPLKQASPQAFVDYQNEIEMLAENGGNYFRHIVTPHGTEVEFEDIGNYSKRMINAREMDLILDKAKSESVYIHFDMQVHYALENPSIYHMFYWDWQTNSTGGICPVSGSDSGYCYNYQLGLTNPMQFFTDANAKAYYKRKLRYMISRYGYSTNIGILELFSEVDNAGQGGTYDAICDRNLGSTSRPYWGLGNQAVSMSVGNWMVEMASYIKEDLQHSEHPIAVSYTGGTNHHDDPAERIGYGYYGGPDVLNDPAPSSPYIDVIGYNMYRGVGVNRFAGERQSVWAYQQNIEKPLLSPETGYGDDPDYGSCDNGAEWLRQLWITPFMGFAANGFPWDYQHNEKNYWYHYGRLNAFMQGNTLGWYDWQPRYSVRTDDKAEMFALLNKTNSDEIIGVVINKTYNFYTQSDTLPCHDEGIINPAHDTKTDVSPGTWSNGLGIADASSGDYWCEWYDVVNDIWLPPTISNAPLFGDLTLVYPSLTITGVNERPILAFKATRMGFRNVNVNDTTAIPQVMVSEATPFMRAVPNPATDIITINTRYIAGANSTYKIMDMNQKVVATGPVATNSVTVNINALENGLYLIQLSNNQSVLTQKIVIQHAK